jgi:hypothetical protein
MVEQAFGLQSRFSNRLLRTFLNRNQYHGKHLLHLLLALAIPTGLLYLRVVFEYIRLVYWSDAALALFFFVQLIAARYLQRFFHPAVTKLGSVLQYGGAVLFGLFCSVTGAVMLEGFGYNFFLRVFGTAP